MPNFLARVGRFSARHRLIVIGAWLLIFASMVGVLVVGSAAGSPGAASTSIPDSQSSRALDRMNREFPAAGGSASAETLQLVFQSKNGADVTDKAVVGEIADVLNRADALPRVRSVSDPFDAQQPYVSRDGRTAVATLTFEKLTAAQEKTSYDAALKVRDSAPTSLRVELGGNLVPLGAPAPGIGEAVGVLVAFLVLIVTFGSLLAAGVNLLLAVFGVGTGVIGVLAYGALNPMGDDTIILAAMIGLAVGIDYSLFILSRFRIELRHGRNVEDAVSRAIGTAGTAVVFAGSTVIVALVGLLVAQLSFITEMGIAAAFGVLVAVLVALTLLPALMRTLGTRALSSRQRKSLAAGELLVEGGTQKPGVIRGWSSFVVKRPIVSIVAGVVVLLVVALPMLSMKTAFTIPGGADPVSTERTAYNLVQKEFGGVQSPVIVLAENGHIADRTRTVEQDLARLDGVQQVLPAQISTDGKVARIMIVPTRGPIDQTTKDLVHEIRAGADSIPRVHLEVTGEAAIGIDQDHALMTALIKYLIVIAVISILLLIIMFRSLLIPLIATLGYLLSVGASFGASVAVFQWGWLDPLIAAPQGDPMLSLLPLLLVGVLFGLAMDYQVFLVSRIKEMHDRGRSPKDAIREGFSRSAPVLIAAASIMTVVFAGFATSSFAVGASIAFGLMIGVLADAFIVRLVLMPAMLSLLGEAAWWMPKWLHRIVPNLDTEGRALDAESPQEQEQQEGRVLVDA